jgi:hypothetical protein
MTLETKKHKAGRSKIAKARKALTRDQLFFYEHAGYSYDPKIETAEQGRIKCAVELAAAEESARNNGWTYNWEDDWDIGSHKKFYGNEDSEPNTCESCLLQDEDGQVLAALGCIDDANNNCRRVVEAELALGAL